MLLYMLVYLYVWLFVVNNSVEEVCAIARVFTYSTLYYTIIIMMSSFLRSLLQLWNCALEVLRNRFVECKCM